MQMPLCVLCLENGLTVPAEQYHHINPYGWAENNDEQLRLLLDPMNVIGLCQKCHAHVHAMYNSGQEKSMISKLKILRENCQINNTV